MKKYLILVFLLFFLLSCAEKKNNTKTSEPNNITEKATADELQYEEVYFYYPDKESQHLISVLSKVELNKKDNEKIKLKKILNAYLGYKEDQTLYFPFNENLKVDNVFFNNNTLYINFNTEIFSSKIEKQKINIYIYAIVDTALKNFTAEKIFFLKKGVFLENLLNTNEEILNNLSERIKPYQANWDLVLFN